MLAFIVITVQTFLIEDVPFDNFGLPHVLPLAVVEDT